MLRTRIAAVLTVAAIATGTLAGAAPAQAASYPFTAYNQRFLDIGPVVYSIDISTESEATEKVKIGGKWTSVSRDWEISQESVSSRAGDQYDGEGNLIEPNYPELPTVHVGYWVARYVAQQLAANEDTFFDSTVEQAAAFYGTVVNAPEATAKAYFEASDAKATRVAAVKSDVLRNGKFAWSYIGKRLAKHYKNDGGVNYLHAHKAEIAKELNKKFTKSKLYPGSVKVKFTSDVVVQMGPTKADRDRFIHYVITVRDTKDKVAYAIDLNTHDGGAYGDGVKKVKY